MVDGITGFDGAEGPEVPMMFVAVTVNYRIIERKKHKIDKFLCARKNKSNARVIIV